MMLRNGEVRDWPDPGQIIGYSAVEIRLEYKGRIPAEKPSRDHRSELKHLIRLEFSNQLRRKWRDSPVLAEHHGEFEESAPTAFPEGYRLDQFHAPEDPQFPFFRVQLCGFAWVPLVTWHNRLGCELEITFVGDKAAPSRLAAILTIASRHYSTRYGCHSRGRKCPETCSDVASNGIACSRMTH
jgi:hypothetical protein